MEGPLSDVRTGSRGIVTVPVLVPRCSHYYITILYRDFRSRIVCASSGKGCYVCSHVRRGFCPFIKRLPRWSSALARVLSSLRLRLRLHRPHVLPKSGRLFNIYVYMLQRRDNLALV